VFQFHEFRPVYVSKAELSLSCGRRSIDQFVLVSGSPLGPMTRFYPYPLFSDNCFVDLPVRRPLWREDGSVTYSATADWSGHWGPITIHYHLIWDCVPSSSPLTTRRDYGGGILTRLHTGCVSIVVNLRTSNIPPSCRVFLIFAKLYIDYNATVRLFLPPRMSLHH
jgi:hypothetical protein